MNLARLNGEYGTEEKCRELLKRLRWPEGVICPRCKSKTISRLLAQSKFECADCQYQFSVTAGTVFHDSHLPLTQWFFATLLLCEAKKGISALQIKRTLGIGGYKTAWYLCHRIRAAMRESQRTMLDGTVEMDTTYDLRMFHASDAKSGTWHRISAKHLASYLEEMSFRFNRRKNPDLFIDTLRHMVTAPVLPFKELTGKSAA